MTMNAKLNFSELFASKRGSREIGIAAASLLIVSLVALVGVGRVAAHHSAPGSESLSAYVAANPELSIVHRYLLKDASGADVGALRLQGLADYYLEREMAGQQRVIEAAIARLDGQAEYYGADTGNGLEADSMDSLWDDLLIYDLNGRYRYGD